MTFLSEYDAIPADRPQDRIGFVVKHLRGDWRSMYSELRENRPVFETPIFTMVTRATDVLDILAQPKLFSVRINSVSMDSSVGPFMLARDRTDINWREKGFMQAILPRADLDRVRALAADITEKAISGDNGMTDVVPSLGRHVPLKVVQDYFGFRANDTDMLRWSFTTQHAMFRNLKGDKEILEACVAAGEQMRAWLWPFLAKKWASGKEELDTSVGRMIALSRQAASGMPPERVVSNVCGLLVGAIETTSQAITQIVDQLLDNNEWLDMAKSATADSDNDRFDRIVFEALRFNPITTIQFRFAEMDREIGVGTPYTTTIEKGSLVAVCTGSAMFDDDLMPSADCFSIDRPPDSYLHFGMGHHSCLGEYVGRVIIPETVRRLIMKSNLRRKPGSEGQIDFADGPFPEHFWVEWG